MSTEREVQILGWMEFQLSKQEWLRIFQKNYIKIIVTEMSKLAQDLDKSEGFLKLLWSKHSTDIGLFHQPSPPYSTIYFKFPIESGVDLNPVSEKTIFVNKNLEPAAIEMLRQLVKMGVICRSYTPWNAQTFCIPKAKPEMSKAEWVNQGNKGSDYVVGT